MKKEFNEKLVDDLADKLLIGLTKEENKMVLDEFGYIDKQINLINKIPNIENITPMTHCLDNFLYELREDEVEESISIGDIEKNCKYIKNDEVKVPKVVE